MITPSQQTWLLIVIVVAVAGGSWLLRSRSRQAERPLTDQDVAEEMQKRAETAVREAREDHEIELDFSPESVEKVETILEKLHAMHAARGFPDKELTRHALKWGGYIGEIIRRNKAGVWALDSKVVGAGSMPIVWPDKTQSFPVAWCYRRIVDGEEDNVWHKFSLIYYDRDALKREVFGTKSDTVGESAPK